MLWNSATTCSGEGSVPGRRAILTGGLALAAAAGLPRRTHADAAPVLVIGAGIAGLAAARELRRAGQPVMVIEARARLGGRLQTSRLWPDRPVDLGASWIHGLHGNPVAALAREAGMSRTVFFEQFKRVTAATPVQYQKRLRLLEAQRLMVE
ncbi:MAG: FAD-dependent oxidoreductase, partial [Rhodobacteraceae bacterium]|nr:FAD-dependent oxidoreductase [Paracoccaceae bacterium]